MIRWEPTWIYAGVYSESWTKAQVEPFGKMKVPLPWWGGWIYLRGYGLLTRLIMWGILFIQVLCTQGSRQKVGFINQQISKINARARYSCCLDKGERGW